MQLLSLNNISKSFAGRTLFANVSFGIEENQRVGLVGPNGAGKSTLLKIIAGIVEPDSGKSVPRRGLRLGYLDQTPTFADDDTIMSAILSKAKDKHESLGLAYEIMAKLELSNFGEDFEVNKLSGGWKKRVALARELIIEPDLMLLDEPTNHLDITSILWLEEYLKQAPFSVLMITHDRLFLQRTVNRILDLSPQNPSYLLSVEGSYIDYVELKEQTLAAQRQHEQVLKNTLRRETEWLRRGAKARLTKQKARIQSTHALADQVDELKNKNYKQNVNIEFGENINAPKRLIEAKGISKSFGDRDLFKNVDLLIGPKTRLALLGDNGCGKSTLIKILLGQIKPDSGSIYHADALKFAYFEQSRETLDPQKSVLKNICPDSEHVDFRGKILHVRSYLDRFMFSGIKAELPVHKLSGGEQARLRIAQLMLEKAQVLILDEPTNDLDVETLNILEEALKDFPGAVILVTHDRYFMDAVSNQILAFPRPTYRDQNELVKFASYLQWEEWDAEQSAEGSSAPVMSVEKAPEKKKARLSNKERYELENMEKEIHKLEERLKSAVALSESQEVATNPKRLVEIHTEISELTSAIEAKYARWTELEAK